MSKGLMSIFRRADVATGGDPPQDKLAMALYGAVASRPAPHAPGPVPRPAAGNPPQARARLVFAFDATASRAHAWATSSALTDALLSALPGQLDVALAVHGGSRLHTFTRFESEASKLRDRAAGVVCQSGETRLLDILARAVRAGGVSTVVYVGDVFEESEKQARKLAAALALRRIRLIILHDDPRANRQARRIFVEMADLTGGCVLPFDADALPRLRELLAAVAVLAVGGTEMLAEKKETMPAARLLLEHLKEGNPQ